MSSAREPLRLRLVSRPQGNNRAVLDGTIPVDGVEWVDVTPPVLVQGFRRMVRELAYDVCEMALTTYLTAREAGVPITALPIFLVRGFHHDALQQHLPSGLTGPADLEGRQVGVERGYTVTRGVWARAVLAEEYDVDLDRVTWLPAGDDHVADYVPPPNVVPLPPGRDLAGLLSAGDLVAAVGAGVTADAVGPLIPDPEAAALAALRRTGYWPINHLVVVRDDLLAAHPWLAVALFEAFTEAKRRYVAALAADALPEPTATDRRHRSVLEATGADPLPYGLEPNRDALEALVAHARRQHILRARPELASVFAAGTERLAG